MPADRDVEKRYTKPEFIAKLRRLADALETGKPFVIQVAGERISVPKTAAIAIEHEREEGREELEFQLSWFSAEEDTQEDAQEDPEQEGAEEGAASENPAAKHPTP